MELLTTTKHSVNNPEYERVLEPEVLGAEEPQARFYQQTPKFNLKRFQLNPLVALLLSPLFILLLLIFLVVGIVLLLLFSWRFKKIAR